jgi:hypothetical protein
MLNQNFFLDVFHVAIVASLEELPEMMCVRNRRDGSGGFMN